MAASLAQKRQFIREMRARIAAMPDRYDPNSMWIQWGWYWNFLKIYAEPRLTECTPEQWKAYEVHAKYPETIDTRTRRGGKSLMLSLLCFFFALIKFGKYDGKVIYRAVFEKQLPQFRDWARRNPFFVSFKEKDKDFGKIMEILDSPPASVDELTDSSIASLGASVLLLDEGGKAKKGQVKEEYCKLARGMVVEGPYRERRIIHASTPAENTYFADIEDYLDEKQAKEGTQLHIIIPYTKCHWITEEVIKEERELNMNAPWIVPQEFECIRMPHGGNFFDQSKLHVIGRNGVPDVMAQLNLSPSAAGVDFNGELVGHIMYEIHWDGGTNVYVFRETKFQHVQDIANWINAHPTIPTEVEGTDKGRAGGYNAGFAAHLQDLGVNCSYQIWDEEGVKARRLAILQKCDVWVFPECIWFIKNFKEANFDEKKLLPTLCKSADQHGLDSVLHGLHQGGSLDIIQQSPYAQQEFESIIDSVRYR